MLRQFLSFSPSRVIKCLSRLNDKEVSFTKSRQRILFLTAAGLLIVGGGWFLYSTGFFQAASSQESLRAYMDDFAPYSHLCFFLLQFLSVVLAPIPSNITAAAGGVLFGTWPSFFLTFAAVVAGSLLLFWLARVLGRDFAGGCLKNISRSSRPRLRCSSLWRSFSPFSQTIFCASWPACPRSHSAALR